MLAMTTRNGRWIRVRHRKSGEILWFRVWWEGEGGKIKSAFSDPKNNFEILREAICDEPPPESFNKEAWAEAHITQGDKMRDAAKKFLASGG